MFWHVNSSGAAIGRAWDLLLYACTSSKMRQALNSFLQERWTLQKLVEQTDQPAAFLKDILPKIARLNRSGPHARLWELQGQYKTDIAAGEQ